VGERQRLAGLEYPRGRQHFGCVRSLHPTEFRETRRLNKVPLLEYRECLGEPSRVLRQPTQPDLNRTADR
jgi:hypothetical protein